MWIIKFLFPFHKIPEKWSFDFKVFLDFFFQAWEGNKRCKQIRDQVTADAKCNPLQVFELLLNTAQFELKIKDMFKHVSYI